MESMIYIHKTHAEYIVHLPGRADGFNTAEYLPTYGGSYRYEAGYEPNLFVKIENTGSFDVINPHIHVNGRRDFFDMKRMMSAIISPGMSDREKAFAIFAHCADIMVQAHENDKRAGPPYPNVHTHPSNDTFCERANPVKAANCYYCSGCSLSAANFVIMCREVGLMARAIWMCNGYEYETHCVAEVYYDHAWHLFDPERRAFYTEEDNRTVASYETLHRKPHLASRIHEGGFASNGKKSHAFEVATFYPPHEMPVEQWTDMPRLVLRPNESFTMYWKDVNKFRYGHNIRNVDDKPYQLANGTLEYHPRPDAATIHREAVLASNITVDHTPHRMITPASVGQPAELIYKISARHPIVGGRMELLLDTKTHADRIDIEVCTLDQTWIKAGFAHNRGKLKKTIPLDSILRAKNKPEIHAYYIKFTIQSTQSRTDAAILDMRFITDVQMSKTALPALSVGDNRVSFFCDNENDPNVRITHSYMPSCSKTYPANPTPPVKPSHPADGGKVASGSSLVLLWEACSHAKEYHVQVSERDDFLYPVDPGFDRIIPADHASFKLFSERLEASATYYWRVRAKSNHGIWSDWSDVWTFDKHPCKNHSPIK